MSYADVRLELAEAASSVENVDVSEYYRQVTRPGGGWVEMLEVTWPTVYGGLVRWQVVVVVPEDVAAAQRFSEAMIPDLVAALSSVLAIDTAKPGNLTIGSGPVPVVLIEGHREEE